MPPHENPMHYTLFYIDKTGELRPLAWIKDWMIENGEIQTEPIPGEDTPAYPPEFSPFTGGGTFEIRGRVRYSRKKLSRRSDWWRWMKTMLGWSYRERRRAIRRAERARRACVRMEAEQCRK